MLPIQFSGHNLEVTAALTEYVHKKFARLEKHAEHLKITTIHIFFAVNKLIQKAEATIHIPGHELFASAEAEDMYHAIDQLTLKLLKQLDKQKEKITHNH